MDPYIGEIRLWTGNWAPLGWFFCWGQQLSIQQYTPLFAIVGVTFGGDGRTNFNLPDLRNKVPIHQGQGPGLTNRPYGSKSGNSTVQLIINQMANHSHLLNAATVGNAASPAGNIWSNTPGRTSTAAQVYAPYSPSSATALDGTTVSNTGGDPQQGTLPHNNMQPYLAMNFMIAYEGVFPTRQ